MNIEENFQTTDLSEIVTITIFTASNEMSILSVG